MVDIINELQEYISNYCCANNIQIDLRFSCFGDVNKFYINDAEFSLDCVMYDVEDIKQFFAGYLDKMWENCEYPMNRVALYIKDIFDMDDYYVVSLGSALFVDEALT